jgi:hypothetical protein
MTHIICRASTCLFWEQGVCGSEEIEYEPDVGCLTFQDMGDLELSDDDEEAFDWEDSDDEIFEEDDDEDEDWEESEDWEEDWGDDA